MCQDEQGLPTISQAPPPGADPTTATCEETGEVSQGAAGQIDTGRVGKRAKAPGGLVILVVNPSTRGFTHLSRQLPDHTSRLEKALCVILLGPEMKCRHRRRHWTSTLGGAEVP